VKSDKTDVRLLIEALHYAISKQAPDIAPYEGQARIIFQKLCNAEQAVGVSRGREAAIINAEGELVSMSSPV